MDENEDSDSTEDNSAPEQTYHTAPNTPDKEKLPENNVEKPTTQAMHISFNAAEGTSGPNTFSLIVDIAGKKATTLFDSGSSDTFMSSDFAVKCNCYQQPMQPRKVTVAGGGKLISTSKVPEIDFKVQGSTFCSAFKVLELASYDIILGADLTGSTSTVQFAWT